MSLKKSFIFLFEYVFLIINQHYKNNQRLKTHTRPIPIEANQLAPVQSTRHSCWVVPTTQPAPIYYRGMLSYCGAFLSSFVLILSSPIQKIFLTLNLKQMLRLML